MKILYLISYYKIGDGASAGTYSLIKDDSFFEDYLLLCRWKISSQEDLKIKVISSKRDIIEVLKQNKYDLIHYIKASYSEIFELTINSLNKLNLNIPIVTTVCQRPSFPNLLLSPLELKYTSHFVFIDKASYNDSLISFIPYDKRSMIYLVSEKNRIMTEGILPKKNTDGVIIYGRGSTLNKCPRNMFEIFDKIDIPNKIFCIVGIPEGDNWVRKEAAKRKNVLIYPLLPFKEWFEICKTFDISLYQIPTDSHASLDSNLGLPMLMQKPTVYYGSAAPKERFIHGVNGFVANNYDEIVEYATLLGKDEKLRHKIGINARISTIEMFSSQKKIDAYNKIYTYLTNRNNVSNKIKIPFCYRYKYLFLSYKPTIRELLHWYPKRTS